MNTVAEIENAIDSLSTEERTILLQHLAEELEDYLDVQDALQALKEPAPNIPLKKVIAELGL